MRKLGLLLLLAPAVALSQAGETPKDATEMRIGAGISNHDITGTATDFKVPADTKIYAWARVRGVEPGSKISIVFKKGDKEVFRQELPIPSVPYRTHVYKTFRKGDSGDWSATALGPDGKELASVSFKVEITS
jgi:hypothetical protein